MKTLRRIYEWLRRRFGGPSPAPSVAVAPTRPPRLTGSGRPVLDVDRTFWAVNWGVIENYRFSFTIFPVTVEFHDVATDTFCVRINGRILWLPAEHFHPTEQSVRNHVNQIAYTRGLMLVEKGGAAG